MVETAITVAAFVLIAVVAVYFQSFGLRDALGMYFRERKRPGSPSADDTDLEK